MKKLEPGMLCRVVNGTHKGKVLTLTKFIGNPRPKLIGATIHTFSGGDWWETDAMLEWPNSPEMPPDSLMAGKDLQPINPDQQPADEEWQADFKRMLSGQPATERRHA